jgi:hypothetical protein
LRNVRQGLCTAGRGEEVRCSRGWQPGRAAGSQQGEGGKTEGGSGEEQPLVMWARRGGRKGAPELRGSGAACGSGSPAQPLR